MGAHGELMADPQEQQRGVDKARPRRQLTALQRSLGEQRLKDPIASEAKVAVRAGYTAATAKNPSLNSLRSFDYAKQLLKEQGKRAGPSFSTLRRKALTTLDAVMSDQDETGSTRVGAAASSLRLMIDLPDETDATPAEARDRATAHRQRLLRLGGYLFYRKIRNDLEPAMRNLAAAHVYGKSTQELILDVDVEDITG